MKHFIDLGTHKFEGLSEFTEKLKIDNDWFVYCYEPNSSIYNDALTVLDIIKPKYKQLEFHNLAVMDYNGEIIFNKHKGAWRDANKSEYISGYTTGSNSLDLNPSYDSGNGVVFDVEQENVKCIDIYDILSKIVSVDNNPEIYIKCDIEGSEFKVLPKLIDSPFINFVKAIYIEWHERFWYNTSEYKNKINEKLNILKKFNESRIPNFTHT
jgi:FkbM family methyltransferase